jgi:formate--tetrahydrofolate ligase
LKLADWVVTEAGFGADLGAEKFVDIKCRKSGLRPDLAVIVATVRALKMHGGVDKKDLAPENLAALSKGMANLERHINNVRNNYGLPCVVAVNHFVHDTTTELELLKPKLAHHEVPVMIARHWAEGGAGAVDLAREAVRLGRTTPPGFRFVCEDADTLLEKVNKVAKAIQSIYGAAEVTTDAKIRAHLRTPGGRLWPLSDLHREGPVLVLDRPGTARCAQRTCHRRARGAARGGHRVHRAGLRRDHDDARAAGQALVGERTST